MCKSSDINTIRKLRNWAKNQLLVSGNEKETEVSQLEVDLLLMKSFKEVEGLDLSRASLFANYSLEVKEAVRSKFLFYLSRRQKGEPIAYIIGKKEFFGYEFNVTEDTLIPRSETEIIVERVLSFLTLKDSALLFDIGTGSGAILQSLALEMRNKKISLTDFEFIATDISFPAIAVAKKNALNHGLERDIDFIVCSLFDPFNLKDSTVKKPLFILSNPPYISFNDSEIDENVKLYEPHSALFSSENGLTHAKLIIDNFLSVCNYWKSDAHLYMEIGKGQSNELQLYVENANSKYKVEFYKDFQNIPRVLHLSNLS